MSAPLVVVDTNVWVAAIRSRRGASFRLLSLAGTGKYDLCLSVPLVLEYESVLREHAGQVGLGARDVSELLDYLCSIAQRHVVFFLWRPQLRDPDDEFVLELAVAAGCDAIVTFNVRDFAGAERFGLSVVRPAEFLVRIGELP